MCADYALTLSKSCQCWLIVITPNDVSLPVPSSTEALWLNLVQVIPAFEVSANSSSYQSTDLICDTRLVLNRTDFSLGAKTYRALGPY